MSDDKTIGEHTAEEVQELVDRAYGRKLDTTDAVVNAPEATFGIPTFEDVADEQADDARTTGVEHMTPDNDPYGWIAGVEAAHPDHIVEPKVGPDTEHVLVWQHAMIEPHRFDHAVARVLPNGTLLVTRPGSDVPLKGYAPGVWVTFEHIGPQYHAQPVRILTPEQQQVIDRDRARAAARPRSGPAVQTTNYMAQEKAAADEMNRLLTDPARRMPPTHEQDADDTQTIPKVVAQVQDSAVVEMGEGGGVSRPFGRGARPDAGYDGHPDRPGTGALGGDEPTPGRLKSLWLALKNPDWSED